MAKAITHANCTYKSADIPKYKAFTTKKREMMQELFPSGPEALTWIG